MKPRALVVEDDPAIVSTLAEILASLGHDYDTTGSTEAARRLIESTAYSYFLIDLEIPVHSGRGLARIENGANLIDELIRDDQGRRHRIIAMTAHGNDGPHQAVEIMRKGIADYAPKPFPPSGEKTLDKSILRMLARLEPGDCQTGGQYENGRPRKSIRFADTNMEMALFPDRVEICGAIIYRKGTSKRRRALELLSKRNENGFVRYRGEDLETVLGLSVGGATGLIRDIRDRITRVLHNERGIVCGEDDVILSGGLGFRLSEKLGVHFGDGAGASPDQGQSRGQLRIDVPNRVPNVPDSDVPIVPNQGDPEVRRNWALAKLRSGQDVRAKDIEREFGCCRKTGNRDLQSLYRDGFADRHGPRRNRVYRLRALVRQDQSA
jgi:CheY-like chemotaxis protein